MLSESTKGGTDTFTSGMEKLVSPTSYPFPERCLLIFLGIDREFFRVTVTGKCNGTTVFLCSSKSSSAPHSSSTRGCPSPYGVSVDIESVSFGKTTDRCIIRQVSQEIFPLHSYHGTLRYVRVRKEGRLIESKQTFLPATMWLAGKPAASNAKKLGCSL